MLTTLSGAVFMPPKKSTNSLLYVQDIVDSEKRKLPSIDELKLK
jgi:hypothetical protein